ncbi:MAG TPA: hypothetical protein VLA09_12480, partial [Longimicrobiales bacterium]|nr:hypothetical protein [Longimicrobiales bacterium]
TEAPGPPAEFDRPHGLQHRVIGFTEDGRLLAVEVGARVQLRDVETGTLVRTLTTPSDRVTVHAQRDTSIVSWSTLARPARIWRSGRGRDPLTVEVPGRHYPRAISADGRRVAATGHYDSLLTVIDAESGRVLMSEEITRFRTDRGSVTFLGSDRLAVSGYDFEVRERVGPVDLGAALRVWDLRTGREIATVRSPVGMETTVFDPEGRYVATRATWANAVTLWDVATGTMTHRLVHSPSGTRVFEVAFSPDGRSLATGDQNGLIKVWDVASGRTRTAFREGGIPHLAFTPDSRELIVSHLRGVKIYDARLGALRATLAERGAAGADEAIRSVAVAPDGRVAAVVGDEVVTWDGGTGMERSRRRIPSGAGSASLAFTPAGRLIGTWSASGVVRGWDMQTGEELSTLPDLEGATFGLAVSSDGSRLAASTRSGSTTIWDLGSGAPVHELGDSSSAVTFGPDGRLLVTRHGGPRRFRVRDLASGRVLGTVDAPKTGTSARPPVAIDRTGAVMAVAEESSGDSLTVYDLRTGELVMTSPFTRVIALAPDGRLFAALHRDARIRDPRGGTEVVLRVEVTNPITGAVRLSESMSIRSAAFSPDGALLATTGDDGTVRIWDAWTGLVVRELRVFAAVN